MAKTKENHQFLFKLPLGMMILVLTLLFVVILLPVFSSLFFDPDEGRVYKSKQALCIDMAQSYLRTVKSEEGKERAAAIAVESDLYNLCLLNLDRQSLEEYKTNNIQRYLEE